MLPAVGMMRPLVLGTLAHPETRAAIQNDIATFLDQQKIRAATLYTGGLPGEESAFYVGTVATDYTQHELAGEILRLLESAFESVS